MPRRITDFSLKREFLKSYIHFTVNGSVQLQGRTSVYKLTGCLDYDPVFMPSQSKIDAPGTIHHIIAGCIERKRMLCFCDNSSKCKSYGYLIMSKVIPINKDPIKNLSDTKFAEIEKDLKEFFNDEYDLVRNC